MTSPRETLEKAYGSVPREVGYSVVWDFTPVRGIRYYWHRLIRKITR